MPQKLTVSELSQMLGVSVNTVWKKIKRRGLTTVKERVNNREITLIMLSDNELSALKQESFSSSPINNGDDNPNYEDSVTIHEGVKMSNPPQDMIFLVESIMNYSRDMNNQVKEYVDRVINAEKQVKLLENLENRKTADFVEQQALIKQLQEELSEASGKIELLQKENEELKKRKFKLW